MYNTFPYSFGRTEVVRVNGRGGAEAYAIGPNSSALLLDESGSIVWLVTTDGAGYKTVAPYDISPHQTAQSVASANQVYHDVVGYVGDKYSELARDISGLAVSQANLLANQNACCCETKQMVMQSNYDGALRDAATNANITSQIQSVKDMIAQNKIESLQAQVNALQLNAALCGVVRWPVTATYSATNPYFPPTTTTTGTGA